VPEGDLTTTDKDQMNQQRMLAMSAASSICLTMSGARENMRILFLFRQHLLDSDFVSCQSELILAHEKGSPNEAAPTHFVS
jgi:hypothetical protein